MRKISKRLFRNLLATSSSLAIRRRGELALAGVVDRVLDLAVLLVCQSALRFAPGLERGPGTRQIMGQGIDRYYRAFKG
jgi:hypothetical protein